MIQISNGSKPQFGRVCKAVKAVKLTQLLTIQQQLIHAQELTFLQKDPFYKIVEANG